MVDTVFLCGSRNYLDPGDFKIIYTVLDSRAFTNFSKQQISLAFLPY